LIHLHKEHFVEEILCARQKARIKGRGREVLVKWARYHKPTWEPLEELVDNAAMDDFKKKYRDPQTHDGPRGA